MEVNYDSFISSLGRTVRYERVRRGFSQEELAQMSRMHRNHLGAVERGERNVSIHNLLRISTALRLPLWRLIQGAEELSAEESSET